MYQYVRSRRMESKGAIKISVGFPHGKEQVTANWSRSQIRTAVP